MTANIAPVQKKGDKHLSSNNRPSNHRPISLISIVAKVMEKIIHH